MTTFVIRRDLDANGQPVNGPSFWCGRNGGGWSSYGATAYATLTLAEAAIRRNSKSGEWTFKRGYAYVAEVDPSTCGAH